MSACAGTLRNSSSNHATRAFVTVFSFSSRFLSPCPTSATKTLGVAAQPRITRTHASHVTYMFVVHVRHMSYRQFVCVESGAVRAAVTGGRHGARGREFCFSVVLVWFWFGFDVDLMSLLQLLPKPHGTAARPSLLASSDDATNPTPQTCSLLLLSSPLMRSLHSTICCINFSRHQPQHPPFHRCPTTTRRPASSLACFGSHVTVNNITIAALSFMHATVSNIVAASSPHHPRVNWLCRSRHSQQTPQ